MDAYHTQTIERDGRKFLVSYYADDDAEAPWSREDGHGPVSEWTTREKQPGEVILASDQGSRRFYDMSEAVKLARRDGWDTPPYDTGTKRQRAARAAQADFERLRAWCNDEWHFCGVTVRPICPECGEAHKEDYHFALWGIESDAGDYLLEVANELVDECIASEQGEI